MVYDLVCAEFTDCSDGAHRNDGTTGAFDLTFDTPVPDVPVTFERLAITYENAASPVVPPFPATAKVDIFGVRFPKAAEAGAGGALLNTVIARGVTASLTFGASAPDAIAWVLEANAISGDTVSASVSLGVSPGARTEDPTAMMGAFVLKNSMSDLQTLELSFRETSIC